MTGKIFVVRKGEQITEMRQEKYESESYLQELIEQHPVILAGDQINPENPRKWIHISREMGVPSEQDGSAQWQLDHLLIDQDAVPTLIEVKRSTDTRIRREVVGQMLDYAANATQYWPIEDIREAFEKSNENDHTLAEIDISPEKEDSFWQTVSSNLRSGRVRLLFVSDSIPPTLKRIIEFLNEQMVYTEVLGVEINQYRSVDGLSTLVPIVIGKTHSESTSRRASGIQRQWDEESFLSQVREVSGDDIADLCIKLIRDFKQIGCSLWWGRGQVHGSVYAKYDGHQQHLLCSIGNWTNYTRVQLQLAEIRPPLNTDEYRDSLRSRIESILLIKFNNASKDKYPTFLARELLDTNKYNDFIGAMRTYLDDIFRCESD